MLRKGSAFRNAAVGTALALGMTGALVSGCSGESDKAVKREATTTAPVSPKVGGLAVAQCQSVQDSEGLWDTITPPQNFNYDRIAKILGVQVQQAYDLGVLGALNCSRDLTLDEVSSGKAVVSVDVADKTGKTQAACVVIGVMQDSSGQMPGPEGTDQVIGLCLPQAALQTPVDA